MTQTQPLVYIVILTWNGKKDTLECLASLKKINYRNYKILVVDNASTDGTFDAVKSLHPDVEYIQNAKNLRFAGGNNVGIEYAMNKGTDYILLLNNDTVVAPDFLERLVLTAESELHVGIVGPKIFYYDKPNLIWYAGGKIDWWKGWIYHEGIREIEKFDTQVPRETDFVTGCCILIRKSVFEKIGKLDEKYYIYGEDVDFCIRAKRANFKILYEPKSKIWHKLSVSTGGHLSWFKNWNKLKSQLRIFYRYGKWYRWISIPFGLIVYFSLSILKLKINKWN